MSLKLPRTTPNVCADTSTPSGDTFPAYAEKKTSRIQLLTVGHIDGVDSPEGYRLSVTPDATTIEATSGAGLFYGLQTLIQLADGTDTITAVDITDSPVSATEA